MDFNLQLDLFYSNVDLLDQFKTFPWCACSTLCHECVMQYGTHSSLALVSTPQILSLVSNHSGPGLGGLDYNTDRLLK